MGRYLAVRRRCSRRDDLLGMVDEGAMRARCLLCRPPKIMRAEDLREHLRDVHGMDPKDIATWPDGAPVVVDDTLRPSDFT